MNDSGTNIAEAPNVIDRRQPMNGGAIESIADLPRDLAVIKMENDHFMSLATSRPRDYGVILADIKSQLSTFKTFAETAMYAVPVGRDDSNRMKYARGLSIRAAEAIACAFGFNRIRTNVEIIDDDHVRVEASFVDYQTSRIWSDSGIVSKTYKTAKGQIRTYSDDRFHKVVIKAEMSRRVREVILRCVPPGIRSDLMMCVDEQLDTFLDDNTVQKIVAQFSTKGVDEEMLTDHIGKRRVDWNKDDRATLLLAWNALEQGESTVPDLFGSDPSEKTRAEDVAKAIAKKKNGKTPSGQDEGQGKQPPPPDRDAPS